MNSKRFHSGSPKRKSSEKIRKGRLVESVVALLHNIPGITVKRNVKLPPLHGDQSRTREIDVLLSSDVAGYPVRIAFSCKNERKKIRVGTIGEFIDQLNEVGIPPQQGIIVSVMLAQITRSDSRRDLPTGFAFRPDPPPFHFGSAAHPSSTFQVARASRQPAELFDSIHLVLAVYHWALRENLTHLGH
jgi:hypothetical protein